MIYSVQRSNSDVSSICPVYQCTPSVVRISFSVTVITSPLLPRRNSPSGSLFMFLLSVTLFFNSFLHFSLLYICFLRLVAEHFPSNSSFSLPLIVVIFAIVNVFSFFIIIIGFPSLSFFLRLLWTASNKTLMTISLKICRLWIVIITEQTAEK